jgi:hypothetical protein
MRVQSVIARLLILLSRRTSGPTPKMPNCFSCTHSWVESGCRWANSSSAAVWAVETGLHGALPMYLFTLDGIARWRLLERKRSPAIREASPTDLPSSRLHQAATRLESLSATELSPSWPMFDPSQYWSPQASLDFLPGLTPSPVEQLQVQQSSNSRAIIPVQSSEGGNFRSAPSMISAYRYPASFDPVFAALQQAQSMPYNETSGIPMQTDILELQTNLTSDPDTRSDCSSASAVQHDVEMEPSLINQLDVGTHEEDDNNINECSVEDLDGTGSDYDNCRLPSPTRGDMPPESASCSPVTASPVEKPSQQTQSAETNEVDRRLPRLSSTLATSSE